MVEGEQKREGGEQNMEGVEGEGEGIGTQRVEVEPKKDCRGKSSCMGDV